MNVKTLAKMLTAKPEKAKKESAEKEQGPGIRHGKGGKFMGRDE